MLKGQSLTLYAEILRTNALHSLSDQPARQACR